MLPFLDSSLPPSPFRCLPRTLVVAFSPSFRPQPITKFTGSSSQAPTSCLRKKGGGTNLCSRGYTRMAPSPSPFPSSAGRPTDHATKDESWILLLLFLLLLLVLLLVLLRPIRVRPRRDEGKVRAKQASKERGRWEECTLRAYVGKGGKEGFLQVGMGREDASVQP